MSLYTELEQFVQVHRACGELTWWAEELTPNGYRVRIACPCGKAIDRWVTPEDAQHDLLRSGLPAFPN